jgi:MYXO-CTERM domain-containing protein
VVTITTGGSQQPATTVVKTLTSAADTNTSQPSSASSSTSTPGLADTGNSTISSGLSGGGKTAVEVIVPIVGVALLVLAALFFWRRRKQRKDAEEIRRKEVEEYGYNPNEDATLPAIGMVKSRTGDGPFEMREDEAGYRGWGTTVAGSSGRKASTTLSGGAVGMAYSEGTSPSHAPISDTRSGDTLIGSPSGRPTSGSEEVLGAMGPSAAANRGGDMHRGPSNASSSYSAANRSDGSGEAPLPGGAYGAAQYYSGDANYGGPYADPAAGRAEMSGQPVIRDNLARRATRIENPSHFPTQASAGISQNF